MNPSVTENRADAVDETASQGTGGDERETGRPANAEQAMLFNDEPTLLDRLSRSELVKRVGYAIIDCKPPVVLGIHGDWGAGKTSFLHQLHFYLKGECPQRSAEEIDDTKCPWSNHPDTDYLTIVWFEAWRYQNEPVPIVALLQEIRTQLPWYSKALAESKKLGEIVMRSALLSLDDLTKKIGLQAATVKTIQETGEKWEQENLATSLPAHMIRAHLDHALGQLLGRADKPRRHAYRLVVLVDDLDRCEPDAAFKLLEGIKIYLNLPSCIFVLGMNQWIIERAIAKQLKAESSDEDRRYVAREYLEKLCQDIWHLPTLADGGSTFLEYWLPKNVPLSQSVLKVIKEYHCLPANPRKIKSIAHVIFRLIEKPGLNAVPQEWSEPGRQAMLVVIMACLYQYHPELYRLVEHYPRFYEQLRLWANGDRVEFEHEVFSPRNLQLSLARPPSGADADERRPTPSKAQVDTFPDPVRGNVLRIQSLIRELGPVPESVVRAHLLF